MTDEQIYEMLVPIADEEIMAWNKASIVAAGRALLSASKPAEHCTYPRCACAQPCSSRHPATIPAPSAGAKMLDKMLAEVDALLCDRMKADPHGTLDKALETARNVRILLAESMVLDDERAAFEAHWCRDVPSMFRNAALAELKANRDGERYKRDEVQWAWEAWQARAASPQPDS